VIGAAYKFGDFELDRDRFELRRNGRAVKLERIPMELLILLVEKDGSVVTRQEIIERLWGKDVFVDTEHGINTAIRKIRSALHEDGEKPRFVQTVLGKGYRFNPERNGQAKLADPVPEIKMVEPELPAGKLRPLTRLLLLAALVLICLAGALLFINRQNRRATTTRIQSIAVLPLSNLSGDKSQDYFAEGLTDELITMLARNTSLHVVSRTTAMQYKDVQRPVREIARELGVDGVVEGSVSRSADHVHMTVQLIYAPEDAHLWADSYDRNADEAYSILAEVSQSIAKRLNVQSLTKPARPRISPEAHDAYLHGRYLWFSDNYDRSKEYFQRAVQLQPDYAAAWSGIADVYTVKGVAGVVSATEIRGQVYSAVEKALNLDDFSPEAHHAAAAYYLFLEWNWAKADAESQRAIELNPQLAEAYHLRSYILLAMNRPEDSQKAQQRSTELDPFARPWALGRNCLSLRKYDAAIKELELRRDAQPKEVWTRFILAKAYGFKGMSNQSVHEIAEGFRLLQNQEAASEVEQLFAKHGARAVSQWFLNRDLARAKKGYVSPVTLAADYAELGRKKEALTMLEAAYRERSPQLIFLQYSPDFDVLHDNLRYRKIVQDMKMEPAY
jgi:TolB-like protein/DNA-binding winged helix-turn-helix (wHTH) protein